MIGLLQCDHVAGPLRSIAGDYDQMFRVWMPADWRAYDVAAGELPVRLDECDAYVTTGSRASVYDDQPWIHSFADFVRRLHAAAIPFAGVCFGHQMIGHAMGGRVAPSPNGWGVGVHAFHVSRPEPWMTPSLPRFKVLMSCRDQVLELPPGARVLASSDHCPVAMFRVGTMLGVQAHPEFPVEYAAALVRHRRLLIGEDRAEAALRSMSDRLSSAELASWVRQFLLTGSRSSSSLTGRSAP
jgi:GMP synthase-like glutamine amidotransferase